MLDHVIFWQRVGHVVVLGRHALACTLADALETDVAAARQPAYLAELRLHDGCGWQ